MSGTVDDLELCKADPGAAIAIGKDIDSHPLRKTTFGPGGHVLHRVQTAQEESPLAEDALICPTDQGLGESLQLLGT